MSAAGSIIGQCEECCECLTATVEWDSRSASKTKCGYTEWAGFVSSPPKYYLTVTMSGGLSSGTTVECGDPPANYDFVSNTETYYGSVSYNASDCTKTGEIYADTATYSFNYDTCTSSEDSTSTVSLGQIYDPCSFPFNAYSGTCVTLSSTEKKREACLTVPTCGLNFQNSYSTLSSEYTTATLKSNTVAALPAYDNDWNDTAGSYANLSTDELTYSICESRYRFRFKIPKVGFGTCYKVTWVERFTPEGGGSPTDTQRCTIWDGTTPSGYDPNTSSTWPTLPSATPFYFELPVPTADGTTTVENVVAECLRCTACP